MKKIIFLLICIFIAGCTSKETAIKAASDMGFTNVSTGGISIFGCSDDDFLGRQFSAQNMNGKSVSGVVCSAFLKGTTLRLY